MVHNVESIQNVAKELVDKIVMQNLYAVELWIAVTVVAASLLLLYQTYRNKESAATFNDEGRILSRRARGESFIGVWSEEDANMGL